MADEINFIKERVEDLGNKYQAFGYLAPEEFNREIKQAQMDEFRQFKNIHQHRREYIWSNDKAFRLFIF
jgi:hypothetical protein